MAGFYWDDLIDALVEASRSVVPIVGSDLLDLPQPDGSRRPVAHHLAAGSADFLRQRHGIEIAEDATLADQLRIARRSEVDFAPAVYAAHQGLLRDMTVDKLPESLRILGAMREVFPLVVTTTTDGLVARALGLAPDHIAAAALGVAVDLPAGWRPGERPRLFHLFGRIESGAEGAVTEEDVLEHLAHLHDAGRPLRLLSHLRESHLLFLGQRFPDWLARVFLRLLRGERFAGGKKPGFDAIADHEIQPGASLVGFLRQYSTRTRIFEEGGSADFLRELHARWTQRQGPTPPPTASAATETEPADMPRPAIFLSYASENRAHAEVLAQALQARGLPVWLDRWQLQGGDRFAMKIERHIRGCRLFVPLLSRSAAARQLGWFRREWDLAREMLKSVGPELAWVLPVVVDDLDPYAATDLDAYFTVVGQAPHVLRCPAGQPGTAELEQIEGKFKAAVRAAAPAPAPV